MIWEQNGNCRVSIAHSWLVCTGHCTAIVSAGHNTSHRYGQKRGGWPPRQGFTSPKLIWVNHTHLPAWSSSALIQFRWACCCNCQGWHWATKQLNRATMAMAAWQNHSFYLKVFQSISFLAWTCLADWSLIIDRSEGWLLRDPPVLFATTTNNLKRKVVVDKTKLAARTKLAASVGIWTNNALSSTGRGREGANLMSLVSTNRTCCCCYPGTFLWCCISPHHHQYN